MAERAQADADDTAWARTQQAYLEAATHFEAVVARVGDRWEDLALGTWSVRGLVGHVTQGMQLWERALQHHVDVAGIGSVVDYFRAAERMDPEVIASAGREVGDRLGPDPVGEVRRVVGRQPGTVADDHSEELVLTPVGGMRAGSYLNTRVVELTIHTADLAVALELSPTLPTRASRMTLGVLADLAIDSGTTAPLLRAATGRGQLPRGFTVL